MYRARFWNKTLKQGVYTEGGVDVPYNEVRDAYENATVPFADQYGSQTSLVDAAASVFTSGTYNWTKYGTNDIDNVSNTLAITYDGGSMAEYGAYNMLADNNDLTTNLVVGKKYRVTLDAKYTGGSAGPLPQVYNGSAYINGTALTTSLVTQSIEFTATHASNGFVRLSGMSAGNVVTIDNWYVREIGCAVDLDLSFAQPEISTQIQDRSTNGVDGTASSGVTQVTKIEQLNANKLSVGGTTPRVGIGLLPGSTPDQMLQIAGGFIKLDADLGYGWGDCNTLMVGKGTADANSYIGFRVNGGADKVTLDSAGTVKFGAGSDAGYIPGAVPNSFNSGYGQNNDTHATWINFYGYNGGDTKYRDLKIGDGRTNTLVTVTGSTGLATFSNGIAFQSATTGSGTTGEAFTLNRYETGTFTPTLSFGGASTGITYDYKEGAYTRIGNICHVAILINLSSKGTSTGAAKIEGLPFPGANKLPSTGIESNLTFPYNTDLSAGEYIAAFVTQLTDKIQLREVSGADRTNANFTDNSDFRLCGSYMCNDA